MSLYALIVILVCHCSIQAQPDNSFYVYHKLQALNKPSSVIKVLKVQGELSCAFSCSSLSDCRSFNLAPRKDSHGNHVCQLLLIDKNSKELEASEVFHHYEKFNPDPCKSHPCQNGGKCDVIVGARDFTCTCPPKFTGKFCEADYWTKISTSPRCFGSRDDRYSAFIIEKTGICTTIKLVHTRGHITCDKNDPKGQNYWGCLKDGRHLYMSVIITDASNKLCLPSKDNFLNYKISKIYDIRGVTATSKELEYPKLPTLFPVVSGQEYRIWFGQDLDNFSEADNDGEVCADVYCLYQ